MAGNWCLPHRSEFVLLVVARTPMLRPLRKAGDLASQLRRGRPVHLPIRRILAVGRSPWQPSGSLILERHAVAWAVAAPDGKALAGVYPHTMKPPIQTGRFRPVSFIVPGILAAAGPHDLVQAGTQRTRISVGSSGPSPHSGYTPGKTRGGGPGAQWTRGIGRQAATPGLLVWRTRLRAAARRGAAAGNLHAAPLPCLGSRLLQHILRRHWTRPSSVPSLCRRKVAELGIRAGVPGTR